MRARIAVGLWGLLAAAAVAAEPSELRTLAMPRSRAKGAEAVERTWRLYRPARLAAAGKPPAVLFLHGFGGSSRMGLRHTGFGPVADRNGFLVAFLDGLCKHPAMPRVFPLNSQGWNDGSGRGFWADERIDDVGFVARVIDELVAKDGADPDRIYVTGHSFGASMTWRIGIELSDRVAAIAPVAGVLWYPEPAPVRRIPVLLAVGELDPLTPPAGGETRMWGRSVSKPSTRSCVRAWGRALGCGGGIRSVKPRAGITVEACEACPPGLEALHLEIAGHGHGYPGGWTPLPARLIGPAVDTWKAAEEIWAFFARH